MVRTRRRYVNPNRFIIGTWRKPRAQAHVEHIEVRRMPKLWWHVHAKLAGTHPR